MPTVVLDSKDLVQSVETGKVIEPADVLADRKGPKAEKPPEKAAEKPAEVKSVAAPQGDEEEDENGLTAEQRKTFTDAMKRTISKKHRQLKEAEEFAAAQYNERRMANDESARLKREIEELKIAASKLAPKVEEAKKPERKDFQSDEAYTDALVAFRVTEQLTKERQDAAKAAAAEAQQKLMDAANAQVAKARELMPDWEETIEGQDIPVSGCVQDYMLGSDKFAELGYFFAKNPAELEKLNAMPARTRADVMKVGIALDAISAKLKPFAEASSAKPQAKENGHGAAKPSDETESAAESAGPSTETESGEPPADPSKPRESAPVIRPIAAGSASQVKSSLPNVREEIVAYQQRNRAVDFGRRKRH